MIVSMVCLTKVNFKLTWFINHVLIGKIKPTLGGLVGVFRMIEYDKSERRVIYLFYAFCSTSIIINTYMLFKIYCWGMKMVKYNPNEPYLIGSLIIAIITVIFNLLTAVLIAIKFLWQLLSSQRIRQHKMSVLPSSEAWKPLWFV